jgi:hypothetical protein
MGEQSNRDRVPGDPMPTFAEAIERLEKVEKKQITVNDLPIGPLQTKLENDWQPSPGVLLPPASIGSSLLADRATTLAKLNFDVRAFSVLGTTGAITDIIGGAGVTVTRTALGRYTLVWTRAFPSRPIVVGAVFAGASGIGIWSIDGGFTYDGAGMHFMTINSTVFADLDSFIIAIGPK